MDELFHFRHKTIVKNIWKGPKLLVKNMSMAPKRASILNIEFFGSDFFGKKYGNPKKRRMDDEKCTTVFWARPDALLL